MNASMSSSFISALENAASSPKGSEVVRHHNEDYELLVGDQPPVLLSMRDGTLQVKDVGESEPAAFSYSRIEVDPEAIKALAVGTTTPAHSMHEGSIRVRARLYGGGQLTRLIRIAQEEGLFDMNESE